MALLSSSTPDLAYATNPCPRYMRHKIETLVGRVRHAALTSLVAAAKSDESQHDKFKRKSLLVEFNDAEQMEDFIKNFSQPFPNDKGRFWQAII